MNCFPFNEELNFVVIALPIGGSAAIAAHKSSSPDRHHLTANSYRIHCVH